MTTFQMRDNDRKSVRRARPRGSVARNLIWFVGAAAILLLAAVEQTVLYRLPAGSREARVTLTTDNGTQFTSTRFIETLNRLGITHRRTAYHHPEGNSYIERFHRSLKEEEVWTAEYRSVDEARASIERWIQEYNYDRPHRGVRNRTPHEAFLAFATLTKNQALTV
jgi:transposase InsO family protein